MINRQINSLLWIGLTGTIILGTIFFADLYRAFWGDRTIWWTHQAMKVPVEETKDNFELFIAGRLLQKHLADGTLLGVDNDGKQYPIVAKDVTVRLNNWDKIKATILGHTTMSGFGFGVALTLLVMGLIQFFGRRKNSPAGK
jgi:hypothetical protein